MVLPGVAVSVPAGGENLKVSGIITGPQTVYAQDTGLNLSSHHQSQLKGLRNDKHKLCNIVQYLGGLF